MTAITAPPRASTVLIVEDDPGIAELERGQLEDAGYRAVVAATAEEALRAVGRDEIDLVLLDYQLPGGTDGLDFYARVKAAGYDLPVILVTGFSNEATVIRSLRAGVRDFVTKSPEYLDYLPEAVGRVLSQVGTERRLAESEARLAGVIGSAKDAVIVVEADRRVSLFNPAAERMFGCPAAAALGRPVTDFIPDELPPSPAAADGDGSLTLRLRAGAEGVRAGGERFPVEASVSRGEAGGRRFHTVVVRDVTARVRATADLRRTADLLAAVVEGTTDAVFVKDRAGRYLLFNGAAARFVGLPVAAVLGKTDAELFDPAGVRHIMERDQRVMATGQAETAEEELTAAGATRTYLATKAPYRDGTGAIAGVVGVSHDITEWRRLAAERDALLARLQFQVARMPLAYILFDADLRITDWNPAAERIFGYTREEMIGVSRQYERIIPDEFRGRAGELIRRIQAGDMTAHSVNPNRTKDGRTITCEWFNTPLLDAEGRCTGFLSLAQDVTARLADEEALRLRDRAIRAVTQGILITDAGRPDLPIIFASPGVERLTGYPAAEMLGRNCRFLQGLDTDPAAVARVRAAVRAGEPCTVELLNYRKDGSPFWNELSVSPVRGPGGRLTHFIGVQTDVTARRDLEAQFRQAQKMEAFGQLAGGVAHDFNNLLTVINGYSGLAMESLAPADPNRALVEEVYKAGERAAMLTQQLLVFSRKELVAPRVIDLNAVVGGVATMLRRLVGEDVRLHVAAAPGLPAVKADPGHVEQVVMNLVVNARDAMPAGGRLTIETAAVELDGAYAREHAGVRPGLYVMVAVADTGAGMTDDVRRQIFEPFFTTKPAGKGTGLGLATVYGIVQQWGGHIGVSSEVGRGTTFKVYLPPAEGAEPVWGPASPAEAAPRGDETVLLVEDEAAVRALSRAVLQMSGYRVLEAATGEDAVRLAEGHGGPVHLLMTDVVMPGLGGRQVAERVTALRPGVRVLYLSGYTDDAVVRHGVLGADVAFLQKPFTPSALARKVRDVLDGVKTPGVPAAVDNRPEW